MPNFEEVIVEMLVDALKKVALIGGVFLLGALTSLLALCIFKNT